MFSDGAFNDDVWNSLVASNSERHPDADIALDTVPFVQPPVEKGETGTDFRQSTDDSTATTTASTITPIPDEAPTSTPEPSDTDATDTITSGGPLTFNPTGGPISVPEGAKSPTKVERTPDKPIEPVEPRRSTRTRNNVDRLTFDKLGGLAQCRLPRSAGTKQVTFKRNSNAPRIQRDKLNQQFLSGLNWDRLLNYCGDLKGTLAAFAVEHRKESSYYSKLVEYLNPALLITLANKEDNPTFKEAMASVDAAGFIKAMEIEVRNSTHSDYIGSDHGSNETK